MEKQEGRIPVSAIDDTLDSQDHQTTLDSDRTSKTQPPTLKVSYKTNTFKAIVCMNLYAIFIVILVQLTKMIVNIEKISVVDFMFVINLFLTILTIPVIGCRRELSFKVEAGSRRIFFWRIAVGWVMSLV